MHFMCPWTGNQKNCKKQVTFSFAFCDRCEHFVDRPGLGQIWTLKDALLNPQKYGVESKRNFTEFFQTRLTLSFNSGNPSDEIQSLFLKYYEESFPNTPIFVAEYHNPGNPHLERDLVNMLKIAEKSSLLMGISFFEFQNRYDQAGHLIWGMFDPQRSSHQQRQVKFEEISMDVPCLSPVFDHRSTIPEKLALAYGGPGLGGFSEICMPRTRKSLGEQGRLQADGSARQRHCHAALHQTCCSQAGRICTIRGTCGDCEDVHESVLYLCQGSKRLQREAPRHSFVGFWCPFP